MPGVESGILTGRLNLSKATFEYLIIPKRDDIDAFTTTPPPEIMSDMYVLNSRSVEKFLKHLYYVDFKWRRYFSRNGIMYKGFIQRYKKIAIDPEDPAGSIKEFEPNAEYHLLEEPPLIDEDFLVALSRSTGAGVGLPKRFHATAIATTLKDEEIPILLNLAEAFLWLQENPGKLRGILILRTYKYSVLIADPITKDELKDEIVGRQNMSVQAFRHYYNRAAAGAIGGEEEEEEE